MSKRLLLLLSVVFSAPANGTDSKSWIQINSPHFSVITDTNEKQGRRIGGQFERMRAVLHEAYPQMESDPESRIVILAIRDKKQFRARSAASRPPAATTAGPPGSESGDAPSP